MLRQSASDTSTAFHSAFGATGKSRSKAHVHARADALRTVVLTTELRGVVVEDTKPWRDLRPEAYIESQAIPTQTRPGSFGRVDATLTPTQGARLAPDLVLPRPHQHWWEGRPP